MSRLRRALNSTTLAAGALLASAVALSPAEASACSYSAEIYTPNWLRNATPMTVCLDQGKVRLEGNKKRLTGRMTLANGTVRRFIIKDSTFGRMTVNSGHNHRNKGSAQLDQLMAYYHMKVMYERLEKLGFAESHLPHTLTVDIHGNHTNAYYKPEDQLITLGYYDNQNDNKRYWYGADGEVVIHELGHAIVDHVQPDIMSVQGASIHEAYADYFGATIASHHDDCVGEYASYIHNELDPAQNKSRWKCTRTVDDVSKRRPKGINWYEFHTTGKRRGEINIHQTSGAISNPAYHWREKLNKSGHLGYPGDNVDIADRVMLRALQLLPVDHLSDTEDGEVLRPRFGDWFQAMIQAARELYPNLPDGRLTPIGHKSELNNGVSLRADVMPNNSLVNRAMPWLGWANHLRGADGAAWLDSDDGFYWQAFLQSAPGSNWLAGLSAVPGAASDADRAKSFLDWANQTGLKNRYNPADAWQNWLLSDAGKTWLQNNVDPAWRAFSTHMWRAFLEDDAWRAFLDNQWRAFVSSHGQNGSLTSWRAFLETAFLNLIHQENTWRAMMSNDAWRALLDRAWAAFKNEAASKGRSWRAMSSVAAGWRAFGDMESFRAYLVDGWRGFAENPTNWRAMINHTTWQNFTNDAWRAYREPGRCIALQQTCLRGGPIWRPTTTRGALSATADGARTSTTSAGEPSPAEARASETGERGGHGARGERGERGEPSRPNLKATSRGVNSRKATRRGGPSKTATPLGERSKRSNPTRSKPGGHGGRSTTTTRGERGERSATAMRRGRRSSAANPAGGPSRTGRSAGAHGAHGARCASTPGAHGAHGIRGGAHRSMNEWRDH